MAEQSGRFAEKAAMSEDIWKILYAAARAAQSPRRISEYVTAGEVAAAVLDEAGEIHTGICVDSCCTLGICAERAAIFAMLAAGGRKIRKVLAILPDGRCGAPCGACRELMTQLMPEDYGGIEIMSDYPARRVVKLGELTPEWWIPGAAAKDTDKRN